MPLAPEARDAMFRSWEAPGNAGSPHLAGEQAAGEIASARSAVAALIGAAPSEIVFTSGATEANNLVLVGSARRALRDGDPRRAIVVSAIEHKAVLEPALLLGADGFEIRLAPVDRAGRIDLAGLSRCVDDKTLLVSVMSANNETGVIQPVGEVARIARAAGALVHTDAAQAGGKIPIDVVTLDIDYLSLSAHKLYGPVGVGALFVSAAAPRPVPLQVGGGQQQGLRSGTEPAPLLAGFGAAAAVARARLEIDRAHGERLAHRLTVSLAEHQLSFGVTTRAPVLPGSLSLAINGIEADELVQSLARHVAISTGSACTSGQITGSHVLNAMCIESDTISSTVRMYCSRYNTDEDIELAATAIAAAALRLGRATGRSRQ